MSKHSRHLKPIVVKTTKRSGTAAAAQRRHVYVQQNKRPNDRWQDEDWGDSEGD